MTRSDARALMRRHGIRRLPVLSHGSLAGIVTLSDLDSGRPGPTVSEIMTPDPATVGPDETLERAALMMLNRRISGLPVVEENKLVGMITETDIFRALVEILGMHDRGARIVLNLHSPDSLLSALRECTENVAVRSLVTYHDPKSGQWKAVVRLRGRVSERVVS